jgi:mRNA-degrading endonuclease toxin of MazEF toxin-antitoxin module
LPKDSFALWQSRRLNVTTIAPAFVISPRRYNAKSSLALLMPITRQQKGYPFEVVSPSELQVQGVILATSPG